jgi:hypothetical protein
MKSSLGGETLQIASKGLAGRYMKGQKRIPQTSSMGYLEGQTNFSLSLDHLFNKLQSYSHVEQKGIPIDQHDSERYSISNQSIPRAPDVPGAPLKQTRI